MAISDNCRGTSTLSPKTENGVGGRPLDVLPAIDGNALPSQKPRKTKASEATPR